MMIGLEIEMALQDRGAIVHGPIAQLQDAIRDANAGEFDGAILDVGLQGEAVFPAARILQERGIPFLFHTGQFDHVTMEAEFPDAVIVAKPTFSATLLARLSELVARG